ncbi:hypothetical protein PMSD_23835 [Paenibacillus macquariensis subsp. defensor]|nr:hypothetical protein PMSD_23835 [Paenibacillus macquariensis subsp. defensor]
MVRKNKPFFVVKVISQVKIIQRQSLRKVFLDPFSSLEEKGSVDSRILNIYRDKPTEFIIPGMVSKLILEKDMNLLFEEYQ